MSVFKFTLVVLVATDLLAPSATASLDNDTPAKLAFKLFEPVGGTTNNSPIIFMHGLTSSKENWRDIPQTVANATHRKAYAVDARNHGESEWRDKFTEDINRDDLLHFMDSMDIQKAILIGHSMGGRTAINAALRVPERVEKLVVEDSYTKRMPDSDLDVFLLLMRYSRAALENIPDGCDLETAKEFVANYLFENLPKEMVQRKKEGKEFDLIPTSNGRYSFRYNIDAVERLLQYYKTNGRDLTGVYKGPAAFFYGGRSPFKVGEEKENIRKLFPAAEFVEFGHATHTVHTDCPAEFTAALIFSFLSRNEFGQDM